MFFFLNDFESPTRTHPPEAWDWGFLDGRTAASTTQSSEPKIEHEGAFPWVFRLQVSEASAGGLWEVGPASHRKEKPRTGRQTHPGACQSALGAVVGKKVVFDFTSMSLSSHGDRTQTRNGASLPPNPWPFSDFMGLKKKRLHSFLLER